MLYWPALNVRCRDVLMKLPFTHEDILISHVRIRTAVSFSLSDLKGGRYVPERSRQTIAFSKETEAIVDDIIRLEKARKVLHGQWDLEGFRHERAFGSVLLEQGKACVRKPSLRVWSPNQNRRSCTEVMTAYRSPSRSKKEQNILLLLTQVLLLLAEVLLNRAPFAWKFGYIMFQLDFCTGMVILICFCQSESISTFQSMNF